MKKRIISAICAAAMIVSAAVVPLSESGPVFAPVISAGAAVSDDSGKLGRNCTYIFDSESGTLTISGNWYMPDYDYYELDKIPWFSYKKSIYSVIIEEGVLSIGSHVFTDCANLSNVTIPNSVTDIKSLAFENCTSLESLSIPNSVTNDIKWAFDGCSNLKSILVGSKNKKYTSIDGVVYDKKISNIEFVPYGIIDVSISDSITTIGRGVFCDCKKLKTVNIPNSITVIDDYAFQGCINLENINIPDEVVYIGKVSFRECSSLRNIVIPNRITSIETETFSDCISLSSVTLPSSILAIKQGAFRKCNIFSDVYYLGTKEQWRMILIEEYNDPIEKATIHCSDGDIQPPHVHKYTSKITKQPTCTEEGLRTYTCECGDTYTEVIPAKGHKFINKTVVPTYDTQGYTEHTCTVCGYSYKDNYTPKKEREDISKATVTVASSNVYSGKALKPAVTVKLNGKTLLKNTDYTVAYKSNTNCGKATVTVTGKGDYEGTKSANFIIKPAKATISSVKSPKTKQIKVTWKKSAGGVTGHEVMIATNKKFSKGKKTYTVKASAASKTITKLKKGTTYYAKVRAYKTVGKTKYYGAWSVVKNVKCK